VFGTLLLAPGLGVLLSVALAGVLVDDAVPTSMPAVALAASLAGALAIRSPGPVRTRSSGLSAAAAPPA
jgi:hypothetical protein